jgi:hypothetical protein
MVELGDWEQAARSLPKAETSSSGRPELLTKQHRQDALRMAYVRAIAAQAGLICSEPQGDQGTTHEVSRSLDRPTCGGGAVVGRSILPGSARLETPGRQSALLVAFCRAKSRQEPADRAGTPA